MEEKRMHWLDISKGILLFLVILGHIVTYNGTVFAFIFAFHMPAFFFLSGYTLNVDMPFKAFFKKKFTGLCIPYLIFGFIALFLSLIVPPAKSLSELADKRTLENFFIYGQPSHGAGTTWFLISLFVAQLLVYVAVNKIRNKYLSLMIVIASGVIGMNIKSILQHLDISRLPWNLSITLTAFPFVMLGYIFKTGCIHIPKKKLSYLLFYLFLSLSVVIVFACNLNSPVNMGTLNYGCPVYYWIAALAGIIMIISLSLIIKQNRFLEFYGRNTMIIFAFQAYVYNLLIFIINKIFDTDYVKMKNIPNYLSLSLAIIAFIIWGGIILFINKIKSKLSMLKNAEKLP